MIKLFSILLILVASLDAMAADSTHSKINIGIEQDLLPYATGGYFMGVWAGKDHLRFRALTARVHKPDFITKDGFTNNDVTAYAVTADYFLHKNWKGWWLATGVVYWKSSIQADTKQSTAHYNNWLLHGGIGYNVPLYKHFYMSPWAALNMVVGGNRHVTIDGKTYTPPVINPEASLKFGIYF